MATADLDTVPDRHVVCPNGKVSRKRQPARSRDGLPIIRATFGQPDCRPCPDRACCMRSADNAGT